MKERLQKILSSYGVASRREAEKFIESGRVTVNGLTAKLGDGADSELDVIALDGVPLQTQPAKVYIMLNKPRGYVTTLKDEKGRRNVTELVAGCGARVYPAGRLDMDSEGLLILSNDGALTQAVTHPSGEKEKTYHVSVRGDVSAALEPLTKPMTIDGYVTRPAKVKLLKRGQRQSLLSVTIHEGRNRQIRKMCAACGLRVDALKRVSEGGLNLGDLDTGAWRYLTPAEIDALMNK
jgi:23S rRNA pseudouridine2605 synthase